MFMSLSGVWRSAAMARRFALDASKAGGGVEDALLVERPFGPFLPPDRGRGSLVHCDFARRRTQHFRSAQTRATGARKTLTSFHVTSVATSPSPARSPIQSPGAPN